ncbi:MAG: S24/S26 family peptidase [Pseudomonadota bacterium]
MFSFGFSRFHIFRVRGASMAPTYKDGDFVLIRRYSRRNHRKFWPLHPRNPAVGDDVVCHHPRLGTILKRVDRIDHENVNADARIVGGIGPALRDGHDDHYNYQLRGLNRLSSSSDMLGRISRKQLLGRVVMHIPR